jgi:hypothetical protein
LLSISRTRSFSGAATAVVLLLGLTLLLGMGAIPAAHAVTSSVVQTNHAFLGCGTSTCTLQASFSANVASGDVIVVGLSYGQGTPLKSLGDSLGTSFNTVNDTGDGALMSTIGYSTLASSGPDTVTATFSLSCAPTCSAPFSMYIFEVRA